MLNEQSAQAPFNAQPQQNDIPQRLSHQQMQHQAQTGSNNPENNCLSNVYTRTENQHFPQHEIAPLLQKMPSVNDFEIREDASGFYSSGGHLSSSFEEPLMADELDLDHYNDITRSGLAPSYPADDAAPPAEAEYIDIESSIDQFLEANGPRKQQSKFPEIQKEDNDDKVANDVATHKYLKEDAAQHDSSSRLQVSSQPNEEVIPQRDHSRDYPRSCKDKR